MESLKYPQYPEKEYWIFESVIFQRDQRIIFIPETIWTKTIFGRLIYSINNNYKYEVDKYSNFDKAFSRKLDPGEVVKYKMLDII